jgi:hypothetical protein
MNTLENKTTIHTLLRRNGARKHPIESAKAPATNQNKFERKSAIFGTLILRKRCDDRL